MTLKQIGRRALYWLMIILPVFLLVILFYNISVGNLGFMPTFEELENPNSNLATEVYSEDGEILGTYFKENRSTTEYNQLSPYLVDALVATEDARFYGHSGIDFRGLARVFVKTIIGGDKSSGGGSTVSQQLAKMLFPREDFSNPIKQANRKFREWVIAVKLEKSYTKSEIIAMYFNQFDFLYHAVGIKSAARVYFNCRPNELNLEQSAMLVGMAKNPSLYNPVRRPEQTLDRRNVVLAQMLKYGKISQAQYDSVKNIPIVLNFQKVDHNMGAATYFREFLRGFLTAEKPVKERYWSEDKYTEDSVEWANNPLFGWCNKNFKADGNPYDIYKDGIKIYTTINSRMQQYAEEAIEEHLKLDLQVAFDNEKKNSPLAPFSNDLNKEQVDNIMMSTMKRSERFRVLNSMNMPLDSIIMNFKTPVPMSVFSWKGIIDTVMTPMDSIRYYKHFLQSGFMAMEPQTGYVKAYVGGINHTHFKYDHVTQAKRQVGSTFKPILYTVAMRDGYSPCDLVPNVPTTILLPDGNTWTPKGGSSSKYDRKMVSLRWGLANSVNNISAWLIDKLSPQEIIKVARLMGISSYLPPYPSLCLGVADVTLKEMVAAYGTYANKGVYTEPLYVTRIEDKNGNIISTFQPTKKEAFDERTAYLMVTLLKRVVTNGTSVRLWASSYPYQIHAEIAGKTGTTQNQSDGWFMGVTPKLVAGVWTGAEERSIHFDGLTLGQGANMALPIWALFMNKVYNDGTLGILKTDTFDKPAGLDGNYNCVDVQGLTEQETDAPSDENEELMY